MSEEVRCKQEKLIYLAGIIDGEGTISVSKRYGISRNATYFHQFKIGNTDIRLIQWLVDNFGGSFPKCMKLKGNRKDAYVWCLSGHASYKLLKKVMPYLLLKQKQAIYAIQLYENVSRWNYGATQMPVYKRVLADDLWQRCKELNKRGRDDSSDRIELLLPVEVRKDILDNWLV